MLYQEYLKKKRECPFCNLKPGYIIKQNEFSILTIAKAPYIKDHLLVVPKRHVLELNKMNKKEKDAIEELIYYAMNKLRVRHRNVNILYREGRKSEIGKGVDHLHYNLIPDLIMGSPEIDQTKREMLSQEECLKRVKRVKNFHG